MPIMHQFKKHWIYFTLEADFTLFIAFVLGKWQYKQLIHCRNRWIHWEFKGILFESILHKPTTYHQIFLSLFHKLSSRCIWTSSLLTGTSVSICLAFIHHNLCSMIFYENKCMEAFKIFILILWKITKYLMLLTFSTKS